ncbi:hypothetical protein D9M69_735640 [compost metagenome]
MKAMALSLFLACLATAAPAMFTWVPLVPWLGKTTLTFSITARSSGLLDLIRRAA